MSKNKTKYFIECILLSVTDTTSYNTRQKFYKLDALSFVTHTRNLSVFIMQVAMYFKGRTNKTNSAVPTRAPDTNLMAIGQKLLD